MRMCQSLKRGNLTVMHRGYNDNTQNVVKGHLRMNLSHESKEKKMEETFERGK